MTTYTLTAEQRGQLMTDLAKAFISSEALKMLQALQPNTQSMEPNNDEVICPNCVHQFRAIPVNVQRLMLDAGFEPPFTHPAPQQTQEHRSDTVFGGPKAREQMLNQLVHPAPQQVAVQMTDDQIEEMALQEDLLSICDDFYALREITRAVEAHHGIGVKPCQ